MRRRGTRNRMRGSAAMELMLSIIFIFLFSLAILDFGRGYLSAQRAQRAARHVAWAAGRQEDGVSAQGAPDNGTLFTLHYEGRGGEVTREVSKDFAAIPVLDDVQDALEGVIDALDLVLSAIGGGDEGRIASLFDFLMTDLEMTKATVTQNVTGLRRVATGSLMSQSHYIALRSWRDSDPPRRVGWWDPFVALSDAIGELGGD